MEDPPSESEPSVVTSPESDPSQASSSSSDPISAATDDRLSSKADSIRNSDKKRGRKRNGASVLAEGQPCRANKVGHESTRISCELSLSQSGCTAKEIGLAEALTSDQSINAMERASSYTSDEWDEDDSALSSDSDDTDSNSGDENDPRIRMDPDSSDDDDPRSQVDRLIEQGTMMFMDGENSALSSEDESDDSDSSDYDSESDITDVSPLMSAATSPIGLSPVLPRRTVPTSPLALHDNSDLYGLHLNPFNWDISPKRESSTDLICDNRHNPAPITTNHKEEDSTNMKLLLQAVIELENHNRRSKKTRMNRNGLSRIPNNSGPLYLHPIRDNPHHTHLNKTSNKRKNMSFSNEEVHKIDRENRILLKKLISEHTRPIHNVSNHHRHHHKPSNSSVNRKRDEQKIKKENLLILRKIQEAKPSKDVTMERNGGGGDVCLSQNGLRSQTVSCGASLRSLSQPSAVQSPRKETAL